MSDLVERLLKRAEIRRSIPTRKSVQNAEPDRIADLLEEAAAALEAKRNTLDQKNGQRFDAASEYLYEKKISELLALLDVAQIALHHYCSDTMRIGSTITPTWADAALKKIRKVLGKK